MRLGFKNQLLLRRQLLILFAVIPAIAFLLMPMKDANPSVLNMPKPFPDIVKSYKSVTVKAGIPGMHPTGVKVTEGDYITILATDTICVSVIVFRVIFAMLSRRTFIQGKMALQR